MTIATMASFTSSVSSQSLVESLQRSFIASQSQDSHETSSPIEQSSEAHDDSHKRKVSAVTAAERTYTNRTFSLQNAMLDTLKANQAAGEYEYEAPVDCYSKDRSESDADDNDRIANLVSLIGTAATSASSKDFEAEPQPKRRRFQRRNSVVIHPNKILPTNPAA
jgi:hypothetical protein